MRRGFVDFAVGVQRPNGLPRLPLNIATRIGLDYKRGLSEGYYPAEGSNG